MAFASVGEIDRIASRMSIRTAPLRSAALGAVNTVSSINEIDSTPTAREFEKKKKLPHGTEIKVTKIKKKEIKNVTRVFVSGDSTVRAVFVHEQQRFVSCIFDGCWIIFPCVFNLICNPIY